MPDGRTGWEWAVLADGPGDGMGFRVSGRPDVIQVTYPCEVEADPGVVTAAALYVYRRDCRASGSLRYTHDPASP